MRKIGIVGGLGPESSIEYYRIIIELYRKKKRDEGSPELIIYSLNIKDMIDLVEYGKWDMLVNVLVNAVQSLAKVGAEVAIIAANTPHAVYERIKAKSPIPMLSIVEETFQVVEHQGLTRVGLLGTKTTMTHDFYPKVFAKGGINIVIPGKRSQEYIHNKLMTELQFGRIVKDTKNRFLAIIEKMVEQNKIQGVILGCTELPLILKKDEFGIPFFNTTKIHAEAALSYSLSEEDRDLMNSQSG
jgi:aspartate racemase